MRPFKDEFSAEENMPACMQVKVLGQEVLAHLYEICGTDAVLRAFNAARRTALERRQARRAHQAVQASAVVHVCQTVICDPFRADRLLSATT